MDSIIIWWAWVLCPDQSRVVLRIPVVMLVINAGALSKLTLFSPDVTNSSPEHIPVIYLVGLAKRTRDVISKEAVPKHVIFKFDFAIFEATLLTLSLLINIYATSIIALMAWCVCVIMSSETILLTAP
jgi:hypothetical protein